MLKKVQTVAFRPQKKGTNITVWPFHTLPGMPGDRHARGQGHMPGDRHGVTQHAGKNNLNFYFGRKECLNAIRLIVTRPLNELSPEEDFILGTMLGYDLCAQCKRYCERCKRRNT